MQYGQIVFILFILLLLYYAGMIVMDLQQAKAAKAAELDNQSEEDIDISDEVKNFKPVQVSRDEPQKEEIRSETEEDETEPDGADSPEEAELGEEAPPDEEEQSEYLTEQPPRHPGYREAIMTDGIEVEKLLEVINRITEDSTSEIGAFIYSCQHM